MRWGFAVSARVRRRAVRQRARGRRSSLRMQDACCVDSFRWSKDSGGLRLAVHDDIFELEAVDVGGGELVLAGRKCDVKVLEEDVVDRRLAGVGLDGAEGGVAALDPGEGDVANDGLRRSLTVQVEVLRPRLNGEDGTGVGF